MTTKRAVEKAIWLRARCTKALMDRLDLYVATRKDSGEKKSDVIRKSVIHYLNVNSSTPAGEEEAAEILLRKKPPGHGSKGAGQ